jgi:heptaprenyl diphosphate synthase
MEGYHIPLIAKKYMDYDMIRIHTHLPEFPDSRVKLLCAFLNKQARPKQQMNDLYALVTALVQMGLDTHDLVEAPGSGIESGMSKMRARQLQVLAGDYFSSRFYQLLSQAGQIDMVKMLSAAICEVNRQKMNLYDKMKRLSLTGADYLRYTVEIKTQLFSVFSNVFQGLHQSLWPGILQSFTACEMLAEELDLLQFDRLYKGWAFWHIMQFEREHLADFIDERHTDSSKWRSLISKYRVSALLTDMLDTHWNQLTEKIKLLESDKLKEELLKIAEPLFVSRAKVLEEL